MKKIMVSIIAVLLILSLSACSTAQKTESADKSETTETVVEQSQATTETSAEVSEEESSEATVEDSIEETSALEESTETEEESVIRRFASSKAAMPLIFIASVILITGIDLLISWNKYEMFFKILGVEILVAVIVWVILTLVFSGRAKKDNSSASLEDEV